MYRQGCPLFEEGAQRAASKMRCRSSLLTSRGEKARALQRSWMADKTPSTLGACFDLLNSLADTDMKEGSWDGENCRCMRLIHKAALGIP